ncbi:MAG: DNRLRE domain-containing protein [Saprospiraceae bacterium]|nr:DNRLRE domain-containing protein [Saprospiraceae bacterium]
MKFYTWFFCLCSLLAGFSLRAQVLVLQPGPGEGQDAFLFELEPFTNFGDHPDFISFYWTFFGQEGAGISLLKFDLTKLSAQDKIKRAYLSLYHNASSTNQGQAGLNACYLKKVISPWTENTVNWNSMPKSTFSGAIYLPQSSSPNQDYTEIEITDFVKEWQNNPSENFGMLLDLENLSLLSSMKFCSSDCDEADRRPKLVIETIPLRDTCLILQPDAIHGQDAFIFSIEPSTNYGDYPDLISFSWTFFGIEGQGNSLLKFDLSQIPQNLEIEHASMSLFYNSLSSNQGQSGNNACYLRKIISNWDENSVTWNTAPNSTATGAQYLKTSNSMIQDYPNIDITDFVKEWYKNPSSNYGMILSLEDKSLFNSMKLCSSDYPDPIKRPILEVCFKKITANKEVLTQDSKISIYPSFIGNQIIVELGETVADLKVNIVNEQGKTVYIERFCNQHQVSIDSHLFLKGIYFIKVVTTENTQISKIIKMF